MSPQKITSRSTFFSSRGASFVEILVAVAIILISALAAGSFFSQQVSTTRNLTRMASCKSALDSQLMYFREMTPVANSYDWTGKSSGESGPNMKVSATKEDAWLDSSITTKKLSAQEIVTSGAVRPVIANYLLDRGSVGTIATMYNNVPNICYGVDMATIAHKGSNSFPGTIDAENLKNFKTKIQIQPYNLGTGAIVAGCQPLTARRQGFQEDQLKSKNIAEFAANSSAQIGYRVKLTGTFEDASGETKSCDSTEDFSYPVDLTQAKPSVVLNMFQSSVDKASVTPQGAVVTGSQSPIQRAECTHNAAIRDQASVRLDIGFKSAVSAATKLDPGTIFLCRDVSQQLATNYCAGAPNAAMNGQNYNGTNARWVPCNEVTACGMRPASVKYSKTATETMYSLEYNNSTKTSTDGLWGCDIRMDVATVDSAGNFTLLSEKTYPSLNGISPTAGKWFPPVNCYACYKKKPFSILTLLAVFVGFGLIGVVLACATGVGGACRVKGARFMYNRCYNQHGSTGKKFCRKLTPKKPDWYGKVASGLQSDIPITCPARTKAYDSEPSLTYNFIETDDGGFAEDTAVDLAKGRYCEASAFCEGGKWFSTAEGEDLKVDPLRKQIESCGSFYTLKQLNNDGSSTSICTTGIPDKFPKANLVSKSYYNQFPVQATCRDKKAGYSYNTRCRWTGGKYSTAPVNALDTSQPNYYGPYQYVELSNLATDSKLPACSDE